MIEGISGYFVMNAALLAGLIALLGSLICYTIDDKISIETLVINGVVFFIMMPLAILS